MMEVPEIKATGVMIGSSVAAFLVFFAGYNLFHVFCNDWMTSTILGGLSAVFVFRLIPVLFV